MVLNWRTLEDAIAERKLNPKPKAVVKAVYDEDTFDFIAQFMYDNDPACEYVFDLEYKENPKQDKTALMYDVMDRMIKKHERTRDCLLGANFRWMEYQKRHPSIGRAINKVVKGNKPKVTLITFTIEENKDFTKEQLIKRMTEYMKSHIDTKYIWSYEEHSAENERPHIHAIAEGYYHTQKNLRPIKDYKGNINCKPVIKDNGLLNYITKETNPKGDLKYIMELLNKYYLGNN